ncbi:MAG: proton-conducting transporter membrane subunit [Polyangiaceae bacterium]
MTRTLHLLLAIGFAPAIALALWGLPRERYDAPRRILAIVATLVNLALVATAFGHEARVDLPWFGSRFDLSLRSHHTAYVFATAAATFGVLVTVFATGCMKGHRAERHQYSFMLLTLGLVNGVFLSNGLLGLLFFWEGLLGTTYGLIAVGGAEANRTATKAFVVSGIGDLCFVLGIAFVWVQTKTLLLTEVHLTLHGHGAAAFLLLMTGALAKCGAIPFHSWIPNAATDAPAPFMAFLPASIEKLVGVYFLSRLTLDLSSLTTESWISTLLMTLGAVTLLLAVFMAVVQDDYRKLLAFAAISQVGFIFLGIGSANPIGIVGALFHTLNHATYKCGMFLTAAAVERRTRSKHLSTLGGLYRRMPVTCACFVLTAASGAGVPFFAGFFSKELVLDAVLERSVAFYLVALLGTFLTTLAFLKMGHAVFFGNATDTHTSSVDDVPPGAAMAMLLPMIATAVTVVLFGCANTSIVEHVIVPMLRETHLDELRASAHHLTGWPSNTTLVVTTIAVSLGALLSHWIGATLNGGGSHATDHVRSTPGLSFVYDKAERRWFDPYELLVKAISGFARLTHRIDRANDWLFVAAGQSTVLLSRWLRAIHRGSTSGYVLWSLVAATLGLLYLGR